MSSRLNKQILSIATISLTLLLLNVSTIYSHMFPTLSNALLITSGLFAITGLLLKRRVGIKRQIILYFILIEASLIIVGTITTFNIEIINYAFKFFIAYIVVYLCYACETDFMNVMFNVARFFSLWALLLFLITIANINISFLPNTGTYVTWWGQQRPLYLFTLIKDTQNMNIFGFPLPKLSYPLSEAGIAQFYTNFCVFYLLFVEKPNRKNRIWIVIFVITSLLTLSLMGEVILLSLVAVYFMKRNRIITVFLFGIAGILIGGYFVAEKLTSASFFDRTNDFAFVFNMIKTNFPFGIGMGNLELYQRDYMVAGQLTSSSSFSGLISPIMYIGVFSIIFYYGLTRSMVNFMKEKDAMANIAFSILLLLTLLTQPIAFTSIVNVFIINGLYVGKTNTISIPSRAQPLSN